ncbi:MAG: tRNA (N(6)-L-threonylcarbamoyladenosine(37)-C(2))-methylthiotransferase [Candidatus Methanomethylicia archaeon]|jgi:threonylcarbamoyladenosine tRNA methylthiotransferase CDKAL1|nr:tRNA (N(6)-L-threonylcarbamoyladenosine(37)-C(2))-methylthiotransferase [Candidatus Methanomethylicia archaeon]
MRVYIKTFGCASNKAESGLIRKVLIKDGFEFAPSAEEADAIVVNTCTVRKETDLRVMKFLSKIKDKKVVVTGCMAAAQPALVSKYYPTVSIVGPDCPAMISSALRGDGRSVFLMKDSLMMEPVPFRHGVKSTVVVSRGCLGECSYCIVRVAKGRLRSISPDGIGKNVIKAVRSGAREIRLTAQDIGVYGMDIGSNLPSLLYSLVRVDGYFRLRVGMFKPSSVIGFLSRLAEVYKSEKIYKFIHVPVQSGSNTVLERMRRGYGVSTFKEVVGEFRKCFPNITVFTDVIVGFPGEDDFEFDETCELLEEIKPDKTHVARYSPRPHTPAASMPQVPEPIKKRRSEVLHRIVREIQMQKNERWIGKTAEATVVDLYLRGGVIARTDEYKTVAIPGGNRSLLGQRVELLVEGATPFYLIGRINRR